VHGGVVTEGKIKGGTEGIGREMRASFCLMIVLAAIVLLADALSSPPPVQTPSSHPGIPTLFPFPLRLRGGHRQSGFRKSSRVNKAIGQTNARRIHAPIREHNVKRSRERLARRGILTGLEGMVEEKKKPDRKPLRKPRLFETTVHDYMSKVEAYKVRSSRPCHQHASAFVLRVQSPHPASNSLFRNSRA